MRQGQERRPGSRQKNAAQGQAQSAGREGLQRRKTHGKQSGAGQTHPWVYALQERGADKGLVKHLPAITPGGL